MNKIIKLATLSVALFLVNKNIVAQDRMPEEMRQELKAPPEERAEKAAKRMGKALNLDATTQQKVYDLLLVRANDVDKAMSIQGREKRQAMKAAQDKYESGLKGVLSPEQLENLEKIEEQMRERRGRGGRGGNRF
jgi:hypothetical protein